MDTPAAFRHAGPLVMIDLPGPTLDDAYRTFIQQHGIRAVILFQRNIVDRAQARQLVAELRAVMGPGAIIGIDQEGGGVVRTRSFPFPPSAMCLGAGEDEARAEAVGAATGRALASLGINWDFAPSLDVNNNPANPVIGDRSFGDDPARVAALGLAWARGCQAAGVATCIKHFPGHGDTHVDSHLGLPTVDKPRAALDALELAPFRTAMQHEVPGVMSAHIVFPALDPVHPATLSRSILTGLLREDWGYDGVIITDAMNMKAIADRYGRGEGAVQALQAGADMVCALGDQDAVLETLQGIEAAVAAGVLPASDLQSKGERLTQLATRFPAEPTAYSAAQEAADATLFAGAWQAGLTALGDPVPPAPDQRLILLVPETAQAGAASDAGLRGEAFRDLLTPYFSLETICYRQDAPEALAEQWTAKDRAEATVVLATTARRRATPALREVFQQIQPDLHLALWNPFAVLDVAAPALVTYGFRPAALRAVLAWLRGRAEAPGQFPVGLGAETGKEPPISA